MKLPTMLRWCLAGYLVLIQTASPCRGGETNVNLTIPERTLALLQRCLKEHDSVLLQRIMADAPQVDDKGRWATHLLAMLDAEKQMKKAGRKSEGYISLLAGGRTVRVTEVDVAKAEAWAAGGIRVLWLKAEDGKARGFTSFVSQNDEWRWYPAFDPEALPVYAYDLSSPKAVFLSLAGASEHPGATQGDMDAIREAIATSLKRNDLVAEYEKTVAKRKPKVVWTRPDFSFSEDRLEEEMLPPEDGKQKCRVWRLDEKGKRTTSELFVKEGDEWKWLPDRKCIWYPAKTEDDPKE